MSFAAYETHRDEYWRRLSEFLFKECGFEFALATY